MTPFADSGTHDETKKEKIHQRYLIQMVIQVVIQEVIQKRNQNDV